MGFLGPAGGHPLLYLAHLLVVSSRMTSWGHLYTEPFLISRSPTLMLFSQVGQRLLGQELHLFLSPISDLGSHIRRKKSSGAEPKIPQVQEEVS